MMEEPIRAIFRCTTWHEEELPSPTACRYRYSCGGSAYPADYPVIVDLLAFFLTIFCYMLALYFTFNLNHSNDDDDGDEGGGDSFRRLRMMRMLSPSGPILLPLLLLVLSNGHRINAVFPLSQLGPVILQLVYVSTLAFPTPAYRSLRYVVLEASTVSGVLHAGMYVDAVVMPYYTGLDLLARSSPTGACATCVCREEALVVGGYDAGYRGLSWTAVCVAATICARLACGMFGDDGRGRAARWAAEGVSWVMVWCDCVYMVVGFGEGEPWEKVGHVAVGVLVVVHVWRRVYLLLGWLEVCCRRRRARKKKDGGHVMLV